MKLPKKSRPESDSALRPLKHLAPDDRADILAWRSDPALTIANARQRLAEKFGIHLKYDVQLRRFWKWQLGQETLAALAEIKEWNQDQLQKRFPDLTRDQIRDVIIKRSYALADMNDDVALALRVAAEDRRDRRLSLSIERWQFDATKAARKVLPELRAIEEADDLTDDEKLDQMRRKMFGVLPEDGEPIRPFTAPTNLNPCT